MVLHTTKLLILGLSLKIQYFSRGLSQVSKVEAKEALSAKPFGGVFFDCRTAGSASTSSQVVFG